MRIGVITDIHNNIFALEAVMKKLREMSCDMMVCCGDIIGIGPCPEETVRYTMAIPDLIAVRGNHEKYLLDSMPDTFPNDEHMSSGEAEHHKWEHSLLSAESIEFLRSLPYRTDIEAEGFKIAVMHYCMDGDGRFVNYTNDPTAEDLKRMFDGVDADIILYGHDHRRTICRGDKIYVNFGSLGCPGRDRTTARAGIIDIDGENVDIKPLDVTYNSAEVIKMIDETDYPEAFLIKHYFFGF